MSTCFVLHQAVEIFVIEPYIVRLKIELCFLQNWNKATRISYWHTIIKMLMELSARVFAQGQCLQY